MNKCVKKITTLLLVLTTIFVVTGCSVSSGNETPNLEYLNTTESITNSQTTNNISVLNKNFSLSDIPKFSGTPYYVVNDNTPYFTENEKTNINAFEEYQALDNLGRCQITYANICKELMPTTERESISTVYPSGWKLNGKSNNNEYDTQLVDGGRIYNRCHLIGFQLAGENANEKNLITGTRYMNVMGMLPFENMIADYVKETNNHVLLRVTPIYKDNDLVARGVLMEAWSVEDKGDGICFNVYCYNVQPGIEINYATGENYLFNSPIMQETKPSNSSTSYILNTNSKKFHLPNCSSAEKISNKNKQEYIGKKEDLLSQNYLPCGVCKP
jgi:DNA-entry nuclease